MAHQEALKQFIEIHFPKEFCGVYVDVGAGYPDHLSNSDQFRSIGWDVVCIEPQPNMCDAFRSKGYSVLEYACAEADYGEVDFEVCSYAGGLGGSAFKVLDPQSRIDYTIIPIKVQAFTLTTILTAHRPDIQHIDILDLDVEYSELAVLRGLNFNKYSPTFMCIENLPCDTLYHNPHQEEVRKFCSERGYKCVQTEEYNEYWVKI